MSRVARASVPSVARDPRMVYLTWWFGAGMILAAAVYYLFGRDWHLLTWSVIGFGATATIVAGTRLNRPADRRPWYLLAAATFTLISGDTTYNVLTDLFHIDQPYPSVADLIYLLTYPLAAAGLMRMIRYRSPRRDVTALLDAAVLTAAMALLLWVLVITPTVADRNAPWDANVVSIAYPMGDVLLLAVILRLATGGGVRTPAVLLLIVGVLGLAGSDISYSLVRLYGVWHVGSAADLGWIIFYGCWGCAALHPSMVTLTQPYHRSRRVTPSRVVPLTAAALAAPTVLFVEAIQDRLRDGPVIAVFSAAMFLLVLARLGLQGRELREQDSIAHTRAMVKELRHRAYRDSLTGLGNRLHFQERTERALARAEDTGGVVAMLLIDLDNFKEVNDTQGHRAGDELLVAAGKRLAAAVRPGDLPVRMGGDEFAVLLADGSDRAAAEALAQRLVRVFGQPFRVSGAVVQVRASIGLATNRDPVRPAPDGAREAFGGLGAALATVSGLAVEVAAPAQAGVGADGSSAPAVRQPASVPASAGRRSAPGPAAGGPVAAPEAVADLLDAGPDGVPGAIDGAVDGAVDAAGAGPMPDPLLADLSTLPDPSRPSRMFGLPVRVPARPQATSEEVLFRNADLALYAAKEDGKGTWRRYEPELYDAAVERLALRTSLDRAITDGEFVIHYQPVVDLRGPVRVTSFEALVRWQHPTLGLLPPDQFIPLAEETGQIIPLGAWILGRATADAADWNAGLPVSRRTRVAVNVSAFQFSGHGLVVTVKQCLAASGLPPQLLILEITETAFLHEQGGEVAAELQELIELGVLIAIDDFGTGYSSISYLRALHFDLLKADKSFVDSIDVADEPQHEVLLRGIVQVAASLGIAVVAEGVETAAQRDILRAMGCAYAQGFLYSPAVPLAEVAAVVAALEKETT